MPRQDLSSKSRRGAGVGLGLLGAGVLLVSLTQNTIAGEVTDAPPSVVTEAAAPTGALALSAHQIPAGGSVRVQTAGLVPGSIVAVLLDQTTIGQLTVAVDGALNADVVVPATVPAGHYLLTVDGVALGDPIEVTVAPVVIESMVTTTATTAPASTSAAVELPVESDVALTTPVDTAVEPVVITESPVEGVPVEEEPVLEVLDISPQAFSARAFAAPEPVAAQAALPPSGAGNNTPGTSSTVGSTVAQGGSLSFTLSGYPAGEQVFLKFDDGQYNGSGVVSGADVVAVLDIGADGKVAGSLTIPDDLAAGSHWLRFLASKTIDAGTLGYTHKSDAFTVTAGGGAADPDPVTTTTTGGTSTGGTVTGAVSGAAKATTPAATTTGATTTTPGSAAVKGTSTTTGKADLASTGVDTATGMAIGAGLLLAGAGLVGAPRRRAQA